jgi:hypothetical protein
MELPHALSHVYSLVVEGFRDSPIQVSLPVNPLACAIAVIVWKTNLFSTSSLMQSMLPRIVLVQKSRQAVQVTW